MEKLEAETKLAVIEDTKQATDFTATVDAINQQIQGDLTDKYRAALGCRDYDDLIQVLALKLPETLGETREKLIGVQKTVEEVVKISENLNDWSYKSLGCSYATAQKLEALKAAFDRKDADPALGVNVSPSVGTVEFARVLKQFQEAKQNIDENETSAVLEGLDFDRFMQQWKEQRW